MSKLPELPDRKEYDRHHSQIGNLPIAAYADYYHDLAAYYESRLRVVVEGLELIATMPSSTHAIDAELCRERLAAIGPLPAQHTEAK